MAGFNLLSALSDADIGDIGMAARENPDILKPPEKGWAGELAVGANALTRFFGLMFNDENAIRVAAANDQQMQQEEAMAVQQRLVPVIGAARKERQEQARQDKLDQQQAILGEKRQAAMTRLMNDFVVDQPDGSFRSPSLEEAGKGADAYLRFALDPSTGLDDSSLPPGLRPLSDVDKQQMITKRQSDLQAERERASDERQAASIAASDRRRFDHEAQMADKATREAEAAAYKSQLSDYLRRRGSITNSARLEARAAGDNSEQAAMKLRATHALAEAADVASSPEAFGNIPYLRQIANDLDPLAQKSWAVKLDSQAMQVFGSERAYPAPFLKFLKSIHPKLGK